MFMKINKLILKSNFEKYLIADIKGESNSYKKNLQISLYFLYETLPKLFLKQRDIRKYAKNTFQIIIARY